VYERQEQICGAVLDMEAFIDNDGYLFIEAETKTERYALEKYQEESHGKKISIILNKRPDSTRIVISSNKAEKK